MPVIRSVARCVLGKAIVSRMLSEPAEEHHHAVDAQRDAAVRRGAELQRVQQESEPFAGRLRSMPSNLKTCCWICWSWIRIVPPPAS